MRNELRIKRVIIIFEQKLGEYFSYLYSIKNTNTYINIYLYTVSWPIEFEMTKTKSIQVEGYIMLTFSQIHNYLKFLHSD